MIESHIQHMETRHAKECLLHVVFDILSYQHENRQLTRFVYREVTIDSTLIREIMSTYLTKEKYLFQLIIEKGKSTHVICKRFVTLIIYDPAKITSDDAIFTAAIFNRGALYQPK